MKKLADYGKYVLITGGSSGIGEAIAYQLAKAKNDLILIARSEDRLDTLAAKLRGTFKIEVHTIIADLSETKSTENLFKETTAFDIGVVIHAAGYGSSGYFLQNPLDRELNMLQLNCASTLKIAYHFGQRFKTKKKGAIVLFSSILAFQGTPFSANYAATKAYVQTLGEALIHEFKPHNISLQIAAPGPTNTGFSSRANMQMDNAMNPEEIASDIIKSIGKCKTSYPGKITKILTYSLKMLPRFAKIKVMSSIMKKMAQV